MAASVAYAHPYQTSVASVRPQRSVATNIPVGEALDKSFPTRSHGRSFTIQGKQTEVHVPALSEAQTPDEKMATPKPLEAATIFSKFPQGFTERGTVRKTNQGNAQAEFLIRSHLIPSVLSDLDLMGSHFGTPGVAMYANRLMNNIRRVRKVLPFDPYMEVAMALYDSLAFDNNWANYNSEQFAQAHDLLAKLASQEGVGQKAVGQSIGELERIGFDTMPFVADFGADTVVSADDLVTFDDEY